MQNSDHTNYAELAAHKDAFYRNLIQLRTITQHKIVNHIITKVLAIFNNAVESDQNISSINAIMSKALNYLYGNDYFNFKHMVYDNVALLEIMHQAESNQVILYCASKYTKQLLSTYKNFAELVCYIADDTAHGNIHGIDIKRFDPNHDSLKHVRYILIMSDRYADTIYNRIIDLVPSSVTINKNLFRMEKDYSFRCSNCESKDFKLVLQDPMAFLPNTNTPFEHFEVCVCTKCGLAIQRSSYDDNYDSLLRQEYRDFHVSKYVPFPDRSSRNSRGGVHFF